MTTVTLDLDATLRRLNKALDFALSVNSAEIARDKAAVANFLARNCALLDVQHVAVSGGEEPQKDGEERPDA